MPARVALCLACANGACGSCTALKADADKDPTKACICKHDRPPRVAPARAPQPVGNATPPPPTSAPFDLDHALAQVREEGRAEGHDKAWLEAEAKISDLSARLAALAAKVPPPPGLVTARSGWDPPAGDQFQIWKPVYVLVELDGNGCVTSVLAAGDDLDFLAARKAEWGSDIPGQYVEAWPVGGFEAIELPAPAAG